MLAPERALGGASVASSLIASEGSRTPGRALDPSADKLFHCWNDELRQSMFAHYGRPPMEGLIRVNELKPRLLVRVNALIIGNIRLGTAHLACFGMFSMDVIEV
jgi:hypothetical protein